jgi:hypothetical protein
MKTTEVSHTPGPWKVTESTASDGAINLYAETDWPVNTPGQRSLASMTGSAYTNPKKHYFNPETLEANRANARLIAAAPDMLEALREILNEAEAYADYLRSKALDEELERTIDQARAAIAKATTNQD